MSGNFSKSSTNSASPTTPLSMYSTDNGAEELSWPDGGATPFRGEKDDELGRRLARAVRHPLAGRDQAGHGHQRYLLAPGHASHAAAAAGEPDIVEKCKRGYKAGEQDLQGPHRRLQSHAVLEG